MLEDLKRKNGESDRSENGPTTSINVPFPNYFHGSNSAGLMDVLHGGLVPTGRQRVVSFAGEMMGGILPGNMNSTHNSVVEPSAVMGALDYCQKNLAGWHPDRSNQLLEYAESCMSGAGTPEPIIDQWREERSKIESARKERWKEIPLHERALIETPFPVLYGIQYTGTMAESNTTVIGERGIGLVPPGALEIFVPSGHVSQVRDLVKSCGLDCPVRPLSEVIERLDSWDATVAQVAQSVDRQWSK